MSTRLGLAFLDLGSSNSCSKIPVPPCRRGMSAGCAPSLALGVDCVACALRVAAPIRNKAPAQGVEGHFAGLTIAADHQQVLARRPVPPRRIIVDAAVAHVHAFNDRIAKRRAALDDSPAHDQSCGDWSLTNQIRRAFFGCALLGSERSVLVRRKVRFWSISEVHSRTVRCSPT